MTLLLRTADADTLRAHFTRTRSLTESLARPLSAEDQTVQSMPDTSPTKWHRAHTTWFFETFLLKPHLAGYQEYDPRFGYLFNSYYEAVGDRHPRPERGMVTRPGIDDIANYRRHVDEAMDLLLDDLPSDAADGADSESRPAEIASLIRLGIHHEQQHQELILMDIKHVLANNIYNEAYQPRPHQPAPDPGPVRWASFPGGVVDIGVDPAATDRPRFWYDNEGPRHKALIEPFQLADRLVTCGEWLNFMADDGYHRPELWLSDGWHTRNAQNWEAPLYWGVDDKGWSIHTLTGRRPVDPNEPVCHISFYEADAYATWAGARLPTEFEWEHAAARAVAENAAGRGAMLGHGDGDGGNGGEGEADRTDLSSSAFHPTAAGPAEPGEGRQLRQLIGDCWEWTGSPYRPYPRYQAPEGAIGEYNGKFMINTMVLRGGCAFTPDNHLRLTYRNFFHPHTRWHLSGLRLAQDGVSDGEPDSVAQS